MAEIKETYRTSRLNIHGEVRKVEEYTNTFKDKDGNSRETKAIILKVDDDDEERIELIDKSSDNLTKYKKGQTGTFILNMTYEKQFGLGSYNMKMYVVDFQEDKEK